MNLLASDDTDPNQKRKNMQIYENEND